MNKARAMVKTIFTESDGRQLAVDMIREIGEHWDTDESLPEDYDARIRAMLCLDPAIMRRYLRALGESKSAELDRGFMCMLTEFVGSSMHGCPLELEDLEERQ